MASLETAEEASERDSSADEPATQALTVPVGERAVAVDVPASATPAETAAIAAAVGAHLTDRQRASAAAASDAATAEYVDRWTLAGRLQGTQRIPRDVERGEEWSAAARSY